MSGPKRKRPRWISHAELADVGLVLISRDPLIVQCQVCGAEWRPDLVSQRPSRMFWKCANGCNAEKLA
jgi:hypothetical protein